MNNETSPPSGNWRQLLTGIAIGIVSVATVLAGVLLASQEPGASMPTAVALATPSPVATRTLMPSPTWASPNIAASFTPGSTAAPAPTIACPVPSGWTPQTVRAGDSLESIAKTAGADVFAIIQGNCLTNTDLTPGQTLYLPPAPTRGATPTRVLCGPPLNWVSYRVQPGDTLYALSVRHGTTVHALVDANCMTGYQLRAGQFFYVPPMIVVTPTAIATRKPSATPPSPTATIPSATPTATTPVTPSTHTPTPSPSSTAPSATPTTTDTPVPPTPTSTFTPEPSATTPPTSPPTAAATSTTAPPSPTP